MVWTDLQVLGSSNLYQHIIIFLIAGFKSGKVLSNSACQKRKYENTWNRFISAAVFFFFIIFSMCVCVYPLYLVRFKRTLIFKLSVELSLNYQVSGSTWSFFPISSSVLKEKKDYHVSPCLTVVVGVEVGGVWTDALVLCRRTFYLIAVPFRPCGPLVRLP